jgi:hypothetical protein
MIKMEQANTNTRLIPIFFIFLLTIIFFYPVLFQGKTFYAFDTLQTYLPWSSDNPNCRSHNPLITDPVNQIYPLTHFFHNWFSNGALPLWNNANFCGLPIIPGGLTQYINPLVFCLDTLFNPTVAHDLLLWLHLFGAGIFMFLYLKQSDIRTYPALIGTVSWMFSGYVMVWFEFEIIPILAMSLPASLYCIDRWFRQKKLFHAVCFIWAIAIGLSSGFAHVVIYQFLFIGSYILYRYFQSRENIHPMKKSDLFYLSLAVLTGLCISATFFTAHISLLDSNQRYSFSFAELFAQTGKLPFKYLITLIIPNFFGNPVSMCFTPGGGPYNNYNELCIYPGCLSVFLILACLPWLFKKKHAPFYFLAAIATLSMAMGSILYYPLMKLIPGLNFSTPTRILYIFAFSSSVLAAIGSDILLDTRKEKKWIIFILWAMVICIILSICFSVQTEAGIRWAINVENFTQWDQVYPLLKSHFSFSSPIIVQPLMMILTALLLLTLTLFSNKRRSKQFFLLFALLFLAYDLISFGRYYNTASPRILAYPATDAIRFLQKDQSPYRIITYGKFMHNTFRPFGIEDVGGYASFYPKRYGEFLNITQKGPDSPIPRRFSRWTRFNKFGSPLLDLLNIKYLLFPPSFSLQTPKLNLIYDKEIKIFTNKDAFPRAFFVSDYQYCSDDQDAYAALSSFSSSDFKRKVILEKRPPQDFVKNENVPKAIESKVSIVSYSPGKLVIKVKNNHKGFLVISDSYHKGWRAEIDGKKVNIFRANYIMKAIPLRQGDHKISLTFFPSFLIIAILFTIIGWGALAVLTGFAYYQGDLLISDSDIRKGSFS